MLGPQRTVWACARVCVGYTPANMNAGGQTPSGLPFWCRGLLQNLTGQAEGCSCQLHRQENHTLALQKRQLKQVPSHPHPLVAQSTLQISTCRNNFTDKDASLKKIKIKKNVDLP